MKKVIYLAAAVMLALTTACSQYKYETVPGDPTATRIYTLDNGLKVYLSVNDKEPRIQTLIAVNVGGKNDPAETTGLAHYFEHLMFKGTPNYGTTDYAAERPMLDEIEALFETYRMTTDSAERQAIYHRIDSISYEASKFAIPNEYDKLMSIIGASGTNAFTTQDMTVYVEDIPSNQVENWLKIESDRFAEPVIRLFHTELETIYEEKNMSLTNDARKVLEALDAALFPHHPYGTQTVLGSQEHLKNPSITNVKNYHKTYYVPNNMAICMSGDFNPNEVIRYIDRYFGDMKPNRDLPKLDFEPEAPITEPVVRDVYGLEAENLTLAWRLPAADDEDNDIAQVAGWILYNGLAGLIDIDLMQEQRVLSAYCYASLQPDYGSFVMNARPKQGQSLDDVRELLLAEAGKLRSGDFDDALIEATVNNMKLSMIQSYESNYGRAMSHVYTFINGEDWAETVTFIERLSEVTKQDIMRWAGEYLRADGYVAVYKRQGKDESIQKITAPKITPVATNRDSQSQFLTEIKETPVSPIEPVFVDYRKDMNQLTAQSDINVLYKQNTVNDLAYVCYVYDEGVNNDPALPLAFDYLSYLGTPDKTAAEISMELYKLACRTEMSSGAETSTINVVGLSENITKAMEIMEDLMQNAVPDEAVLSNLKADMFKGRSDAKASQSSCFGALLNFMLFGEKAHDLTLSDEALHNITSEQLLAKVRSVFGKQHEVLYYGPWDGEQLLSALAAHHNVPDTLVPVERQYLDYRLTGDKSKIFMVDYDANQLYYLQYSDRGEKFDLAAYPYVTLYDEYFGGGMNSIVFQEMREARGLAYTASAFLSSPTNLHDTYSYMAFIATQNDKMRQAIEAFDGIINDMPVSQPAFDIAKQAIIARLCSSRTVGEAVLWNYRAMRELGLDEPIEKMLYDKVQGLTLDDVISTQEQWVKGRTYDYAVLGRIDDLDTDYLKTLGDVEVLSLEDIFGY